MKKITIVAYAICFLSGLWFLFSAIKILKLKNI